MMRKDQEETRNMQRWLDENDHEYRFTVDSLRKKNPALGQAQSDWWPSCADPMTLA
jgi:hypothetical protein